MIFALFTVCSSIMENTFLQECLSKDHAHIYFLHQGRPLYSINLPKTSAPVVCLIFYSEALSVSFAVLQLLQTASKLHIAFPAEW